MKGVKEATPRVLLIDVFLIQMLTVFADLTVKLRNTEAIIGQRTYLYCSTSNASQEIHWYHYSKGSTEKSIVYGWNQVRPPYLGRYHIEKSPLNGAYNLVIPSVATEDAGMYVCQDSFGVGDSGSAELIVLSSIPICESNIKNNEVIGPNGCGIPPDDLRLSCSVAYHGNVPPVLEWSKVGENTPIKTNVTYENSGSVVRYNMTLRGKLSINEMSYLCHTTRADLNQYSCSTGKIRILYAFGAIERTQKGEVLCSANSSLSCSYRWIRTNEKTGDVVVPTGRLLSPDASGLHRCEADCIMKGKTCSVEHSAMMLPVPVLTAAAAFMVTEAGPTSESNEGKFILVLILWIVSMIIIVALVIVYFAKIRPSLKTVPKDSKEQAPLIPADSKQYYFIRSQENDLFLGIDSDKSGSQVKTMKKNEDDLDGQLWYDDLQTGTIRSKRGALKVDGLCLDIENNILLVRPEQRDDINQQWMRRGMYIKNYEVLNKCLGILDSTEQTGTTLSPSELDKNPNVNHQKFVFEQYPSTEDRKRSTIRKEHV